MKKTLIAALTAITIGFVAGKPAAAYDGMAYIPQPIFTVKTYHYTPAPVYYYTPPQRVVYIKPRPHHHGHHKPVKYKHVKPGHKHGHHGHKR